MRSNAAGTGQAFFSPLTLPLRGPLPLPQGERGIESRLLIDPSPLAGEGGARASAWEGEGSKKSIEGNLGRVA